MADDTPFWGERLCYHCGGRITHCVVGGMWYPDAPYECKSRKTKRCGGAMERWEGIAPHDVTEEDRHRWESPRDGEDDE